MPFLALLKAPTFILGIVAFLAGVGSATFLTRAVYTGKIAKIELRHAGVITKYKDDLTKQADEATAILIASKDAALDKERALVAENSRMEAENATLLAKVNGTRLANGRLIDATCGLFDQNGRPVTSGPRSGDGMSGSAGPTFSAQGRPASCDIPDKVLAAVREFGHEVADLLLGADQAAVTAATGIDYATTIEKALGAKP